MGSTTGKPDSSRRTPKTRRRRLRLAVLDVDGTLKQAESPYGYLHRRLGVADLAAPNRALALAGQISYA